MRKTITLLMVCFMMAMAHGDGDALFKQGAAVFNADPAQAYSLFVQAAEEEHVSAMVGAGHCLEHGTGTEIDYAKAIEWYGKAVEQNNLKACEGLARIFASCPDPNYHDGAKAVKYASVLARKNSHDADALALLAAAYARNMEFENAGLMAGKAAGCANNQSVAARIKRESERYDTGEPFPPVATDAWLLNAAKQDSLWAISCMARKSGNRFLSSYNAERAMRLCQKGIDAGNNGLYALLGRLYLDDGELSEGMEAYAAYKRKYETGPIPYEVAMRENMIASSERLVRAANEYKDGTKKVVYQQCKNSPYCRGECGICGTESPLYIKRNANFAYFLYRILAQKGNAEAPEVIATFEQEMSRGRNVLDNIDGLDKDAQAEVLNAQATNLCSYTAPVNLDLAEEMYLKSFQLKPSSKTAYSLGVLLLRDNLQRGGYKYYIERPVGRAIYWLELAHERGNTDGSRRLIELYSCDKDPLVWNGALAVEYAIGLVESCPVDDHDARQLLACAYARNGQFMAAKKTMQEAMKLQQATDEKPDRTYVRQYARFEKEEAWSFYHY